MAKVRLGTKAKEFIRRVEARSRSRSNTSTNTSANPFGASFVVNALENKVEKVHSSSSSSYSTAPRKGIDSDLPEFITRLLKTKPIKNNNRNKNHKNNHNSNRSNNLVLDSLKETPRYTRKRRNISTKLHLLSQQDIEYLKKFYGPKWNNPQVVENYLKAKEARASLEQAKKLAEERQANVNVNVNVTTNTNNNPNKNTNNNIYTNLDKQDLALEKVKDALREQVKGHSRVLEEIRIVTDIEYFCKDLWIKIVKKFQQYPWKKKLAWGIVNYIKSQAKVPAAVGVVIYTINDPAGDLIQVAVEVKNI